jgi:hypothetical protein
MSVDVYAHWNKSVCDIRRNAGFCVRLRVHLATALTPDGRQAEQHRHVFGVCICERVATPLAPLDARFVGHYCSHGILARKRFETHNARMTSCDKQRLDKRDMKRRMRIQ